MIIVFMIAFSAGLVMLFTGFVRSAVVHSGVLNEYDNTRLAHQIRRRRLRRHWLITFLLFAIAFYAGMNL